MATPQDFHTQMTRLSEKESHDLVARLKCYDMHGGAHPNPNEKPMPTIITQFGSWAVTPFGVECLVYPYEIQWDSITDTLIDDSYWLTFLSKKDWVNLQDFADAMHHGRKIHRFLQGLGTNNTLPDEATA